MITKVTKENKALYKAWFEKAGKAINLDEIDSLDDYFAAITRLAQEDPIYTVLPLDEPTFDIDANARTIKVPDDFKKNGISVQGDEIAEIIYFSVDRYFDATDLFDKDIKIVIQWEGAPYDKKAGLQGVSKEWIRDITTLKTENKMIFGWALNSHITKHPGTIKFAVRFYKLQTGKDGTPDVVFSLSTLPQTAMINPSLDFEIIEGNFNQEIYDDSQRIKDRLKDSVTPDGITPALPPYFLINTPLFETSPLEECWGQEEIGGKMYNLVDLKGNRINPDNFEIMHDNYTFKVQATSDDAGNISYTWFRKPLNSDMENNMGGGEVSYQLTSDTVYDEKHIYYTYNDTTEIPCYEVKIIAPESYGKEIPELDRNSLYEKYNTYVTSKTGLYRVEATNRVGLASTVENSNLIKIPGPAPLTLTYDKKLEHLLLDEEGNAKLITTGSTEQKGDFIHYKWDDELTPDIEHEISVENGVQDSFTIETVPLEQRAKFDKTVKMEVYASRNGDNTGVQEVTFRITDPAHAPKVDVKNSSVSKKKGTKVKLEVLPSTTGMASDTLSYQWYKFTSDAEDSLDPLANDVKIEGAIEATYDALDPVVYYCVVTNHVNGSTAKTASKHISVSEYA